MTDTELSYLIKRSVSAIQKKRWKLKNESFHTDTVLKESSTSIGSPLQIYLL